MDKMLEVNFHQDAFVKIARNEGITSLWSGLPPTLVAAIPTTVLYFTTYDYLKAWLTNKLTAIYTFPKPQKVSLLSFISLVFFCVHFILSKVLLSIQGAEPLSPPSSCAGHNVQRFLSII